MWTWLWVAWIALFAASFAVIEYVSLRDSKDARPPLTQVIRKAVPGWALAVIIGGAAFWSMDHFVH
jgi:uncharacterized membrane protein YbhN (UPF0104 family)